MHSHLKKKSSIVYFKSYITRRSLTPECKVVFYKKKICSVNPWGKWGCTVLSCVLFGTCNV